MKFICNSIALLVELCGEGRKAGQSLGCSFSLGGFCYLVADFSMLSSLLISLSFSPICLKAPRGFIGQPRRGTMVMLQVGGAELGPAEGLWFAGFP